MFDIGALELLVIGLVALLVLGPERLPKVARTAGLWIGRARRSFMMVKAEIDREIKAEELREILRKQSLSNPLETIIEDDGSLRPRRGATRSDRSADDEDDARGNDRPAASRSDPANSGVGSSEP
ncbi:MAG: twin-arginine translocase subunit TatB [Chromatiaceae bacterium]|nr:MAG: twin-arginine translocase subunit TatB [Chromatiaceae bacterium]